MGHRVTHFEWEIKEIKSGGGLEAVVAAEQRATTIKLWVTDLCIENEKQLAELTEATQRLDLSDKELNDARADLCNVERQLKEPRAIHRKVDNDLLKAVRELEAQRADLPRQAIKEYKESIGFKLSLHRMGQVSYEYGYWVMLV
ncbi:hypothetical protein BHE74_00012326 [Ensete ventricosum]|nr:hypothetical protein GW17_00026402 [Ensete ventricosum]RWW79397.1 hypothetical protein BHE74_00012326 [Ensete ventricosum]RZR87122.1 hypothetical protein BHM03_00014451 [Ensete ventricosum]